MWESAMIVYILISLFFLVVPTVLTVYWFYRERYSGMNLLIITAMVFLSIAAIRFPLNIARGENVPAGLLHAGIRAMQTISTNEDFSSLIEEGVRLIDGVAPDASVRLEEASGTAVAYIIYAGIQYVGSLILCGFALVKAITSLMQKWTLKFFCFRPVFFFSHLTEESILLARSIQDGMQERRRKALFCFADVRDEMDETLEAAWKKADLRSAAQLKSRLAYDLFPLYSSNVSCVLCHPEEHENLKLLSQLLAESKNRKTFRPRKMKYFVHASSRQAEQIIDHLTSVHIPGDSKNCNQIICMLNHRENLAVQILDQIPLHEYAAWDEAGRGELNILIVGSTPLAERFLCNAFSCGQMANCRLSITLADPDAEACRDRIYAMAPLLGEKDIPLVSSCGELRFHTLPSRAAIADSRLLRNMHYVFLAYEDDGENIKYAQRIRTLLERQQLTAPEHANRKIAVVYTVENPELNHLCATSESNPAEWQRCRMYPVGSLRDHHSTHAFFGNELLLKAFFLSRNYHDEKTVLKDRKSLIQVQRQFIEFMNSAYGRRSSVASALHMKYREYVRNTSHLPREQADALLIYAEHLRWNAYMIMSGFITPSQEELDAYFYRDGNNHRSLLLKMHPCLAESTPEPIRDLWADGVLPADELDRVSLRIHGMLLERLRAYLPALPVQPKPKDLAEIAKQAHALADPADRAKAEKMVGALFNNFKQYDMNIVRDTEKMIRLSNDPVIRQALRLFWLEADQ